MSHRIHKTASGQDAFFSAREPAWHRLGQVTKEAQTSKEAMKLAHLDYEVGLAPIYADMGNRVLLNEHGRVTGFRDNISDVALDHEVKPLSVNFATYRKDTNTVFRSVGKKYEPVQNWEAFAFFDDIVGKGEAIYETAGALGDGETIFVSAKLPRHISLTGGEAIDEYLLFTNTHDGTGAVQILFTPVRVVCANTLHFALNSKSTNRISLRHTKSVHDRISEAAKVMGLVDNLEQELAEIFGAMWNTELNDDNSQKFFQDVFFTNDEINKVRTIGLPVEEVISTRKRNIISDVEKYYHEGVGQSHIVGTVWGAYNAVTGYYQNVKDYGGDDEKMMSSLVLDGSYAGTNKTAFKLAKALLN